jgi:hypothetical protein
MNFRFKKDKAARALPKTAEREKPDASDQYLSYAYGQPYGGVALQKNNQTYDCAANLFSGN